MKNPYTHILPTLAAAALVAAAALHLAPARAQAIGAERVEDAIHVYDLKMTLNTAVVKEAKAKAVLTDGTKKTFTVHYLSPAKKAYTGVYIDFTARVFDGVSWVFAETTHARLWSAADLEPAYVYNDDSAAMHIYSDGQWGNGAWGNMGTKLQQDSFYADFGDGSDNETPVFECHGTATYTTSPVDEQGYVGFASGNVHAEWIYPARCVKCAKAGWTSQHPDLRGMTRDGAYTETEVASKLDAAYPGLDHWVNGDHDSYHRFFHWHNWVGDNRYHIMATDLCHGAFTARLNKKLSKQYSYPSFKHPETLAAVKRIAYDAMPRAKKELE